MLQYPLMLSAETGWLKIRSAYVVSEISGLDFGARSPPRLTEEGGVGDFLLWENKTAYNVTMTK